MKIEIPIEPLLRRLAETPMEFLGEPKIGPVGDVSVAALVYDLMSGLGVKVDVAFLDKLSTDVGPTKRNSQKLMMIAIWLLADPSFAVMALKDVALKDLFDSLVPDMAEQASADKYVHDVERREELVRAILAQLDCLPEGESEAQAADRLARISNTQRMRLLKASRAAEVRAREVREALARKAAQESADKWTRE